MPNSKRIPIPLTRRLKHLRARLVPMLIFAGAVTLTAVLWMQHTVMPNSWGAADAVRYDVGSHVDGTLVWEPNSDGPQLYQRVEAGDVVARLDDRPVIAALEVIKAERKQLESQLAATLLQAKLEQDDRHYERKVDSRRLAIDIEKMKLELLDRDAMIAADRIDQQRRDEKIKLTEELVNKGSQSEFQLFTERMQRDVVVARVAGNEKARTEASSQLQAAEKRYDDLPVVNDPEFDLLLAPIREGMAVQQARMRELDAQIESLILRAPIAGTIVAVLRRPRQAVVAGEPILTIASEESPRIIAYIRAGQRIDPKPDMTVMVRARSNPSVVAETTISFVGPQFEAVPLNQLANPSVPEFGLPVSIHLPDNIKLRPGEIVDLTFKR